MNLERELGLEMIPSHRNIKKLWARLEGKKAARVMFARARKQPEAPGIIGWFRNLFLKIKMARDFEFIMKEAEAGRLPR